jgi:type I restriction enzyme, R subunit
MHTETEFENIIEKELLQFSGYEQVNAKNYDSETALFPTEIIKFIQETQLNKWEQLAKTSPNDAEKIIIDSLTKELKSRTITRIYHSGDSSAR